jgi:flagellar biosynthesis protein FlhB
VLEVVVVVVDVVVQPHDVPLHLQLLQLLLHSFCSSCFLVLLVLLVLLVVVPTFHTVTQELLLVKRTAEEIRQHLSTCILIKRFKLVFKHDDLL